MVSQKEDIGKEYESEVSDWSKLITDLRETFPYGPVESLIIETFANSIDAEATEIRINVTDKMFQIIDNGKGMTKDKFREYHNIASLSKVRGVGIGFAGVGAKIFLDRADNIVTETKTKDSIAATDWHLTVNKEGKKPKYVFIEPKNDVPFATGTSIKVKLKLEDDQKSLSANFVEEVMQKQYNAVLLGMYGKKDILINGKKPAPWQPIKEEIEKNHPVKIDVDGNKIEGFLIKTKSIVPGFNQGINIVVHGKTVKSEWFKQYPIEHEKFTGMIKADYLISILATSKSDFNINTATWRHFYKKAGENIGEWLDKIGAKPRPIEETDKEFRELGNRVEKAINDVLKMPGFKDLTDRLFQNIILKQVGIKANNSDTFGKKINGMQKTRGTMGGKGSGNGVPIPGPDEGTSYDTQHRGKTPIKLVRRRVKSGIKITFDAANDLHEGWIDPANQTIVINISHPAYVAADNLDAGRKTKAWLYHVVRTTFNVILDEAGMGSEEKMQRLSDLFSSWSLTLDN